MTLNFETSSAKRSFKTASAWAAVVLSVFGTISTESFARNSAIGITRNDCLRPGTAGDRGRQMGARNARNLFNNLWLRLQRSCDQLDRLGTIISDTPLARPAMGGIFSACFHMGYVDELWNQLGGAYDRCQVKCFGEGLEVGRISAQGYCAASMAVGGLYDPGFISQPPLPFCGENLVLGCKAEYIATATFDIPGCVPYTTGYFNETFENSVRQDCFVPSDVPIRDDIYLNDGTRIRLSANASEISDLI